MSAVVGCPSCGMRHQVPEQLLGKQARCRCGATLQLPARPGTGSQPAPAAAATSQTLTVQCPGCQRAHQADRALAGRMVRCGCGAAFQVPGGAASQDPLGLPAAGGGFPVGMGLPGAGGGAAWDDLPAYGQAAPMPAHGQAAAWGGTPANANPYAASSTSTSRPKKKAGSPGRCPNCGGSNYSTPVFTWWGGMVGQHLLSHVVCKKCRTAFNSKTGRSNTPAIIIYHVVILALLIPVFIAIFVMGQL